MLKFRFTMHIIRPQRPNNSADKGFYKILNVDNFVLINSYIMHFFHKLNGFGIKPKNRNLTPTGQVNKLAPEEILLAVQRRPIKYESRQIQFRLIYI